MIPEISLGEFLLFTIIALIIIKPDDWPKVLRKVGYYYGQIHDFILETRRFTQKTYDDIILQADPDIDGATENNQSEDEIDPPDLAGIDCDTDDSDDGDMAHVGSDERPPTENQTTKDIESVDGDSELAGPEKVN